MSDECFSGVLRESECDKRFCLRSRARQKVVCDEKLSDEGLLVMRHKRQKALRV